MAASDAAAPAFPLADSELFKESSITTLEGLLKEAGPHAVKAGKALLRLYQIYPARLNRDNVVAGLALALTALPKSDFQLALYLVPAPVRADAAVVALEECERLLQMGRFTAFWEKTKAAELAGPLASAAEFANGIRGFMLEALNRMYQRVELPTLNTYLDLVRQPSFVLVCYGVFE